MKRFRSLPGSRPSAGAADESIAASRKIRKNSHSVLIQRAVLFTALDFLAAVIIGSPVFHLADALGAGRFASLIGLLAGFIAACAAAWPLS